MRHGTPARRVHSLAPAALAAACVAWPGTALADGQDYHEAVDPPTIPRCLTLPLEIGDATAWVRDRTGPVYRASATLLPGVLLGPVSLHLPLELQYRNPGWDFALGGRLTFLVAPLFAGFVPLRVVAAPSYLVRGKGAHLAGGLMGGLGELLYVTALYAYETDREVHSASVRFGINLLAFADPVGAITHYVPQQDIATPRP
jgi:hypothetical protein